MLEETTFPGINSDCPEPHALQDWAWGGSASGDDIFPETGAQFARAQVGAGSIGSGFIQKLVHSGLWYTTFPVSTVTLSFLRQKSCSVSSLSVQLLSRVQLFVTPWTPSPGHQQLPEFTQTHVHRVSDAIQPSHPLSSPSPPAFNLSQHQGLFQWVSSSHQVAKVLEFQLQHQSFQWIFRTDFL